MVKLGAIGIGGLGYEELETYDTFDDVDIVAGADISQGSRDTFEERFDAPAYEDYMDMLDAYGDELDAVTIVTPHTLHYDQVMECFANDINVFVEKPMATDLGDAVEMVQTADEEDLVLQVGYQRHFEPLYRRIREMVDEGEIGEIHSVSTYLEQDWISQFHDKWRTDPALSGGGELYDSGSHLLDAMLWTTGTRPRQVSAVMDSMGHDVDVNSATSALLEREADGRTVTASILVSGDGVELPPGERLTIMGTDGKIDYLVDKYNDRILTLSTPDRHEEIDFDHDHEYPNNEKLRNFIQAVKGEEEPAVPGEFGLYVTALSEAAYRSHEDGEMVDVRDEILHCLD